MNGAERICASGKAECVLSNRMWAEGSGKGPGGMRAPGLQKGGLPGWLWWESPEYFGDRMGGLGEFGWAIFLRTVGSTVASLTGYDKATAGNQSERLGYLRSLGLMR